MSQLLYIPGMIPAPDEIENADVLPAIKTGLIQG